MTLPLTLPGTLIGAIFVFVPSMGNFIVPELLGGGKTVMVGNLIRDQFLEARNWPFGAVLALSVVGFLILLFALQALRGATHQRRRCTCVGSAGSTCPCG